MSLTASIERLQAADTELAALSPMPFAVPITGLEAVVAGAVDGLQTRDWWVPGLRERAGAVLRGVPVERLVDGFRGAKPYHVCPPTPAPALRALHAVGLALADRSRCVLVHLGIGSTADGDFYEALNLAALQGARVVFLVAVHPLGEGAPVGRQVAGSPAALASALGIRTVEVDGSRAHAVSAAVSAAREADGPTLIEAHLEPGSNPVERAEV